MNNIERVYEIFKDFYGEDKVDLQQDTILVHFPKVTVTNENDRSIDITHLFVKTKVSKEGAIIGYPTMNRSEYTKEQFNCGYVHSHLPQLSSYDVSQFSSPCLGTGPIRDTIRSLIIQFNPDLWNLYCYELSLYVTRESLAGGPYLRLESVGIDNGTRGWVEYNVNDWQIFDYLPPGLNESLDDFYIYVIKSKSLPFCFYKGSYTIALSPYETIMTLSNLFIKWYNTLPDNQKPEVKVPQAYRHMKLLEEVKCKDGKIYIKVRGVSRDPQEHIGKLITIFKGKEYRLNVLDVVEDETPTIRIVNKVVRNYILNKILRKVNYELRAENVIKAARATFTTSIKKNRRYL